MNDIKLLYRNYYRCPRCGYEWEDEWDCMVDDECGECETKNISPFESHAINEDGDEI